MFRFLKFLLFLGFIVGFVWFGTQVKLGKFTLFQHFARIWNSKETQDLVDGTKESAGPAFEKFKKGVKAGVEEAGKDDDKEVKEKATQKKDDRAERAEKTSKE